MKKLALSLSFLCSSQSLFANGGNVPPEEYVEGYDYDEVVVPGFGTALSTRVGASISKANAYFDQVTIDLTATRNKLKDFVPEGWGEDLIKEKIDSAIDSAEQLLISSKATAKNAFSTTMQQEVTNAISQLDPKAKFQGKYKYKPSDVANNQWTAIAANPKGNAQASVSGTGSIQFQAGVAVGFTADADFGLTLGGSVGIDLTGFNPVTPTDGSGQTISVDATPTYECPWSFTGGGQALLQLTITVEVTYKDTLPIVTGTLDCQ